MEFGGLRLALSDTHKAVNLRIRKALVSYSKRLALTDPGSILITEAYGPPIVELAIADGGVMIVDIHALTR
jgi:hypothetical protein